MAQLLRLFIDIVMLRRGPQDLPASVMLAWLVALVYAVTSALQVIIMGWALPATLLLVVLDLGLQAGWLWVLLRFFGKTPRFLQTITAFLGVGALLTLLDIAMNLLLRLLGVSATSQGNPWPILHLALLLLLLGRVLQHALERSLFMSMAVTLVIMLTISVVAQGLVPGA